ncbi:MAG: hypothetical protein CMI55_04200 [Parcubacteria group bacterium]|jgi:HSP20 family protein|nr:hypothetical protein [Parcubacteria group bacterium]|tara:strand:+ start:4024 stop:4575 length:552 start_codon:yes stop_codon:yes gene_type:complete
MNKKQTFFEKLTGASWPEVKKGKSIKQKKGKPTTIQKDFSVEKEKKVLLPKKTAKVKTMPKKEPKESEDWLNESEGQLTIDVYQTSNEVVIKSTIAGVSPEDIDITMTNDMITIKGTRQKDEDVKEEDYYYQECYWGPFSRSIILPVDVEVDQAQASMKNGILTIKLPKIEKIKTKRIEITSE